MSMEKKKNPHLGSDFDDYKIHQCPVCKHEEDIITTHCPHCKEYSTDATHADLLEQKLENAEHRIVDLRDELKTAENYIEVLRKQLK